MKRKRRKGILGATETLHYRSTVPWNHIVVSLVAPWCPNDTTLLREGGRQGGREEGREGYTISRLKLKTFRPPRLSEQLGTH